jgi:hypothetical protein
MIELLLAPENTPFGIALAIMVFITIMELITTSMGFGMGDMLDSLLPEMDFDVDLDLELEGAEAGDSLVKVLSWFRVGEVPVLMLFIVFLTGFGLSGLALQYILSLSIGTFLPASLASLLAFLCALPIVRFCGGVLGRFMPGDETYAVSEESFVGQVATIILGEASTGNPVQASLQDVHGLTHYIMVEPDVPDERFPQGEQVLIVRRDGALYRAIHSTSSALTDS